jgi:hypothetical protein
MGEKFGKNLGKMAKIRAEIFIAIVSVECYHASLNFTLTAHTKNHNIFVGKGF